MSSTLSPFNTTTEVLLVINGCPLLRVCVHGVCAPWMGKCRARIPSIGHHTWLYVTSLSLTAAVLSKIGTVADIKDTFTLV